MYTWTPIGSYFAASDIRIQNNPVYSNLATLQDVIMYADKAKTLNRCDLVNSGSVLLHGSDFSHAYPFFEIINTGVDDPMMITFKMRVDIVKTTLDNIGGFDYFLLSNDSNTSLGALGVGFLDAQDRELIPFFIDHNNSIKYPLTDVMQNKQWFNCELLYFRHKLQLKLNDRIINCIQWNGDLNTEFQLKIKGDYFYFDYADINILRSQFAPVDIDFTASITNSDVYNGSIDLTGIYKTS